jgi:hypothetical protein
MTGKPKKGKKHEVIMNAVNFKLLTRVFAIVRRTPFVKLRQAG